MKIDQICANIMDKKVIKLKKELHQQKKKDKRRLKSFRAALNQK